MTLGRLERFPDEILEYAAKEIAGCRSGSEITEFFRVAGYPQIRHDGSTKWRFVYANLQMLNSGREGQYHVAKIIEKIADPKQHIGKEDLRLKLIDSLNEALIHMGIQLNKDGRLVVTERMLQYAALKVEAGASDTGDDARRACRTIPAEIRRQLLVEAGHRCAVTTCAAATPLETHHIVPWSEQKSHDPDHMIVLCSNCHGRAHKGDIDRKSLYRYKQRLREIGSPVPHPAGNDGLREDWPDERDRPRFAITLDGVARLETEFTPQFKVRQFSGDPVANLQWRIRGPRFGMERRQASGVALDRTHFLCTFDLTQTPHVDEVLGLNELGLEIRFHWRGHWRTELHRWPVTRRELPTKVLCDVGAELLPPIENDEG